MRIPVERGPVAVMALGALAGLFAALNALAAHWNASLPLLVIPAALVAGAGLGALLAWGVRASALRLARRFGGAGFALERYRRWDWSAYAAWLVIGLSGAGVPGAMGLYLLALMLFCAAQAWLMFSCRERTRDDARIVRIAIVGCLFGLSGFAALVYQVVWQRLLAAAFGVNVESVTVIVAVFMFGLGMGALLGGLLSRWFPRQAIHVFAATELSIGTFGLFSVALIGMVGEALALADPRSIAAGIGALLLFPTLLMGATLPVLVTHLRADFEQVAGSLGVLYFVNTLGSALACFATVYLLFVHTGQGMTVAVAALCNFAVGILAWRTARGPATRAAAAP